MGPLLPHRTRLHRATPQGPRLEAATRGRCAHARRSAPGSPAVGAVSAPVLPGPELRMRCLGAESLVRAAPGGGKGPQGGSGGGVAGAASGPTCTHLPRADKAPPGAQSSADHRGWGGGLRGLQTPLCWGVGWGEAGLGARSWGHLQVYHQVGTGRQVFPSSVKAAEGQGTKQKKFL